MKFSKDSGNILHLGRKKLILIRSGNGLSGEHLCCKDGQECKQDSAVHPNILGCINRPVIIGWLWGWSTVL